MDSAEKRGTLENLHLGFFEDKLDVILADREEGDFARDKPGVGFSIAVEEGSEEIQFIIQVIEYNLVVVMHVLHGVCVQRVILGELNNR